MSRAPDSGGRGGPHGIGVQPGSDRSTSHGAGGQLPSGATSHGAGGPTSHGASGPTSHGVPTSHGASGPTSHGAGAPTSYGAGGPTSYGAGGPTSYGASAPPAPSPYGATPHGAASLPPAGGDIPTDGPRDADSSDASVGPTVRRFQKLMRQAWWLHSFGALAFGVGVMLFARKGLEYADTVLLVLVLSWVLVFVAFRFIVGAANTSADERRAKKGLRLVTNYVIKQLYQQMFFFLVPLYASSATWSLTSFNWWLVPILLTFAVLSTMDLVFDNFIMERRIVASTMYGFCVFAVLNMNLPLAFGFQHFDALLIAAATTAPMVALLGFRMRSVLRPRGIFLTAGVATGMVFAVYYGRTAIPPAPMAMSHGSAGHGTPGEYECVPGPVAEMRRDQLDLLRCVTHISAPGGLRDQLVHVWRHSGTVLARLTPERVPGCGSLVVRSTVGDARLPRDPRGKWSCTVETGDGQLVGRTSWRVVDPPAGPPRELAPARSDANRGQ